MDILKSIRVLAARAVDKKDGDYVFRYLCRWYSRTFHTPIAEAETIPVEEILQHYFESQYEDLDEEELEGVIALLIETESERTAREAREARDVADDEAFFQAELAQAKLDEAKTRLHEAQKEGPAPWAVDADKRLGMAPDDKKLRELPPDIKITFVSESELDELDARDLLGPPGKRDQE